MNEVPLYYPKMALVKAAIEGETMEVRRAAHSFVPLHLLADSDERERELFIDNLQVRIHFVIVMIRWTGLAPWE